ncbi:MAG: tetratricopeptide repeat protein [Betaproteobacteria bacterium]|nr:tetratricopeptide repeat protein [Betaproteobacteria bacterium]
MMRVLLPRLTIAACLVGCVTSVRAQPAMPAAQPLPVPAAAAQPASSGDNALTAQRLYEFLVAEVAAQRGQWGVASQMFLKLARETGNVDLARNAVEASLYARQGAAAQSAARLWLSEDPDSMNALHAVIALLLGGPRPADALPYLRQAMQKDPAHAGNEFMRLGGLLAGQADRKMVLGLVQTLAAEHPKLAEAHLAVAQAAARAGDFDTALHELDGVDALKPDWDVAAELRFEVLEHHSPAEADTFAARYLGAHPKAADLRLAWGRTLLVQNRPAEALVQFALLAQQLPQNAEMQVAVGLVSLQLNDPQRAEAAFRRALELNYHDPGMLDIYLGQIAEATQHEHEAADWYRAVPPGPQYILAQIRYAALLAHQGKLPAARDWLQGVTTTNDDDRVQLIRAEAQLMHEAGDDAGAYDVLGKALATRPDSVDLLYDHALMAEPLDKLDVVEHDLRHLLKIKPDYAQALNALGYTYADHNIRLNEAVQLLQQALKLDPDDAYILDSMGWAQYRLGNLPLAAEYLQRAYHALQDPEIAAHLGEVLWKQGKRDEARQLWQSALPAHPDNPALRAAADKFK